jgi:hypothetical protein
MRSSLIHDVIIHNYIFSVEILVLTAVVKNVAIFWDTVPCSLHVSRLFGGKYHLHLQGHIRATWRFISEENYIHFSLLISLYIYIPYFNFT